LNNTLKTFKTCLFLFLIFINSCAAPGHSFSAPNVTIKVTGVGSSLDDAQKSGFRDAIQQVYGTLTLSERRVTNDKLFEDDVSYAKGIIEKYQVLSTNIDPKDRLYRVTMLVTVSPSLIQKRILDTQDASQVDGSKIRNQILNGQAQAISEIERINQSKRLFEHFTNNLGKTLFEVKNGDIKTTRNGQNIATTIEVKVSVSSKSHEDLCTVSKEHQKNIGAPSYVNGWPVNFFEIRIQPCGVWPGWTAVAIEKEHFNKMLSSIRSVGICLEALDKAGITLLKFFQNEYIIEEGYPQRKFGVSAFVTSQTDKNVILITRGNRGNDIIFEVPLPQMSPNALVRISEIKSKITDRQSCN